MDHDSDEKENGGTNAKEKQVNMACRFISD
jgi:hypothetical protein